MKIAIVILNWNGQKLLEQFLPSIIQHSNYNYCDIYVADNASTDDSISFVKSQFLTVKIIQNTENFGFAKGYNVALKNIDANIFALVNSDIEVTQNWLDPILDEFEQNSNTAIIQPKILDYKNKESFEYAGAGGGYIDKYGFPFCRGRIFDSIEKNENQYNDTTDIFWATGACFFIRSEVFEQLNGFDSDFFAHQEEIDLCWRATNLGHQIKYVGASAVYHVGGATLTYSSPNKTYLNFRNGLYLLVKNLPKKSLFKIIFTRLVLDGIAGIKFMLELKPKHTWAILKAHFSFYSNLKRMESKRNKENQKTDYFKTKNVVWSYFIKKKKIFNSLPKTNS